MTKRASIHRNYSDDKTIIIIINILINRAIKERKEIINLIMIVIADTLE